VLVSRGSSQLTSKQLANAATGRYSARRTAIMCTLYSPNDWTGHTYSKLVTNEDNVSFSHSLALNLIYLIFDNIIIVIILVVVDEQRMRIEVGRRR